MFTKTARVAPLVATAALALSVLVGCGSSSDSSSGSSDPATTLRLSGESAAVAHQLNELYKAAIKNGEKTVAVDTLNAAAFSQPNVKGFGTVIAKFEELFPGIKVQAVDVSTTPLTEKIAAEEKTGQYVSDVALTSIPQLYQLQQSKSLTEFTPANATNLVNPTESADPLKQAYEVSLAFVGLAYNTSKLSADEVPTSWDELAQPEWKGKFSLLGPGQSQVQGYLAQALYLEDIGVQPFDREGFKKVIDNAVITNNIATYTSDVAAGKFELNLFDPAVLDLTLKTQGQPIDFLDSEATVPDSIWTGVLAHAPHPNAARLFDAFLLSQEGQQTIATGTYFNATVKDIPANSELASIKRPEHQVPFDKVVEYTKKAAELATELYPAGASDVS